MDCAVHRASSRLHRALKTRGPPVLTYFTSVERASVATCGETPSYLEDMWGSSSRDATGRV